MMMMMMMMMMIYCCGMVDRQKVDPYFQSGPLSEILHIVNLRHAGSRIWTCAEPVFRLWWMKLCSSDNHYTKAPLLILLIHYLIYHYLSQHIYFSSMHKLFKCMNENNNRFLWTDHEEKLWFQKEVTPITNFEKHSFLIRFTKTI